MEQGLKDILEKAKEYQKVNGEWFSYPISCHTLINIIELVQEQEDLLVKAVKVIEPFAEEPVSDLDKDTDRDEFWMEVGHFRKASTFFKNVKRLPLEADNG